MKRKKSKETTRSIIAITHVTLDGVMQAPGGTEEDPSNGFAYGGWSMPFRSAAGRRVIDKIMAGKFDLLLGRRTYQIFAGYWPDHGDNPIGKAFNKARKYVVTRTLSRLDWKSSIKLGGDVVEEVRRLKASKGPSLHVWGSSQLLQALTAAELIDEYCIWIFPVVLGKGKRLFENSVLPRGLDLVKTATTPSGVLINTYRPLGLVKLAEELH